MITKDNSRDELLTNFGKTTLTDRYLLPNESYQDMFARVAGAFADNAEHAQRMYDYISKLWFMPATPVLSNGGTNRGLPISCYLNEVGDSLDDIIAKWTEDSYLGAGGGGIGTGWSKLRSIGEAVRGRGHSSGIVPFIRVLDSLTMAISQGSLRRGAAAAYLDISHPEIEEFLQIRTPSGDYNRKSLNLHHGVTISDAFMKCVEEGKMWQLIDPHSKNVKKEIDARELFSRILEIRLQTGEPYIIFSDSVNNARPDHHKMLGLKVTQSNLCSEIMLPTGRDHLGIDRTAVCCLGSLNLETWDEWFNHPTFVEDCLRFLDNVLEDFIAQTAGKKGFDSARYSAMNERSVGLGVMGLHSLFQQKGLPFESPMAKGLNMRVFKHIRQQADMANIVLAREKGSCPDAEAMGIERRFSYMLAIAPTASISIIAGGSSPCVEPWNANVFTQKTLSGSFDVRNRYLERDLELLGLNTPEIWTSILLNEGSIQHLDLPDTLKDVYKTSTEIDQRWVIEMAADRTPYIDQGQSINLFLEPDVHKFDLMMIHFSAWKKGLKSLYYLRSRSLQRAQYAGSVAQDNTVTREKVLIKTNRSDYEECTSCQ